MALNVKIYWGIVGNLLHNNIGSPFLALLFPAAFSQGTSYRISLLRVDGESRVVLDM
jgi:hypothetical protein